MSPALTARIIKYVGLDVHAQTIAWAMAHKLARILWHLLKYKEPFNPEVYAKEEAKMKRKKLQRLEQVAASLNFQLVPQP